MDTQSRPGRRRVLGLLLGAGVALAGCGRAAAPGDQGLPTDTALVAWPARGQWPAQVQAASGATKEAYYFAVNAPEVLAYMPCYCGCGETDGHVSNEDCFVKERRADGSVVLDAHGFACGVCVQIARAAAAMRAEGKTVRQIRDAIDTKYAVLGGATQTPMPPE